MSMWSRIQMFFSVKTNAALERMEDPRDTLAYGYARQQQLLREVKRGLIEVATSRRQLELQAQRLRERAPQLDEQAQRALAAGREDLARLALQRKQACIGELARLDEQLAEVAEDERKLILAEGQFAQRLETFRLRREALSARYTAAESQVRISEAIGSVSEESAELEVALGRAEVKISRMQARAAALDALIEAGTLSPPDGSDPIEEELRQIAEAQAVEAELAALKAKMQD